MASDYKELREALISRHSELPPQLKLIGQFILDKPEQAALMRISDISERLAVQPSAVIRFSKAVGFNGFSEVQKILRSDMVQASPSYFERIESRDGLKGPLDRFAALGVHSLQNLPSQNKFDTAVKMLCKARTIHSLGLRRAYGVAAYFSYLLSGFDAEVSQIEFSVHMNKLALSTVRPGDLLFVISFPNYSIEVLEAIKVAKEREARVIVLTDSEVSPVAQGADLVLTTDKTDEGGFRSAVGTTVTLQALAIAFGEAQAG
ncbi:MAG: MurR/RpiR family transcriptional regulator [Alphaproteobacteria bacterium]